MSRRNVLNSSRFYVRNLFRQREIENNLFCLRRYRISGILSNERENSNVNVKFEIARHYTQAKSANCWNCHKPMDIHTGGSKESFFCSSCGSLHDVNGNYVREWMHFEQILLQHREIFYRITLRCSESPNNFKSTQTTWRRDFVNYKVSCIRISSVTSTKPLQTIHSFGNLPSTFQKWNRTESFGCN